MKSRKKKIKIHSNKKYVGGMNLEECRTNLRKCKEELEKARNLRIHYQGRSQSQDMKISKLETENNQLEIYIKELTIKLTRSNNNMSENSC